MPRRAVDPFGGISRVDYDGYDLLPARATDPVGNVTAAASDYRVLQPAQVTDPNGNRVELAFDLLGQVAGTAVMGKPGEARWATPSPASSPTWTRRRARPSRRPARRPRRDPGQRDHPDHRATLARYHRTRDDPQPAPPVAYTLARETHVSDLARAR